MFCDLHLHSSASDGTVNPVDLPRLAAAAGLGAIALTDHDTTEGLPACAAACRKARIDLASGIELSADPGPSPDADSDSPMRRGTLHILGLFVRHDAAKLLKVCDRMRAARESRNPAIVKRLNDLGIRIEYEEVVELARREGARIIGRPHIAEVLTAKGYVKSVQDAFARYLRQSGPAYVRRDRLGAEEAMDAIHDAGGLAILAHPLQLQIADPEQLECFVRHLKDLGLDGIEARHSDHSCADVGRFEGMASRHRLLISGGSDFHGTRKPIALGSQRVPMEVFRHLRCAAVEQRASR